MATMDRHPSTVADTKTADNNSSSTDAQPPASDVEKQEPPPHHAPCCEPSQSRLSAFSSLGFLDRFLAVWIFLAMLIGILLGNFVDDVQPALQRGNFVGVSLPIGMSTLHTKSAYTLLNLLTWAFSQQLACWL
jgi:ACR3 family arsenite transporter